MISVNLEKAKDLKKQILRRDRAPILQKLDIEFQRALENGSDTSDIISKKQALRDATLLVNQVENIEQLKAIDLPDVGV